MANIKNLSAEVTCRLRPGVEGATSMRRARKKGETKAKATVAGEEVRKVGRMQVTQNLAVLGKEENMCACEGVVVQTVL